MILKKIKVSGTEDYEKRKNLFISLGKIYNINFSPEISLEESDGLISFNNSNINAYKKPAVFYSENRNHSETTKQIDFKDADFFGVDFSNKSFKTNSISNMGFIAPNETKNLQIVALQEDQPIWFIKKFDEFNYHYSAVPPKELPEFYSLKDFFCSEDFISLFPLLVFIREMLKDNLIMPERKASVIIDDPNLHASSYGYINYNTLINEAKKNSYHVSIATIPLDYFWASKKTVSLFSSNKKYVSLVVHGNNHNTRELLGKPTLDLAFATLNQINKRISKINSRFYVDVQKVITAPHGVISRQMLKGISYYDFAGVVISRPFPWYRNNVPRSEIKETKYFTRWFPADITEGTPIIPRMVNTIDVPFKLFLNIPLVFFYHHWDFKNGYDFLAQIANEVKSYSSVNWTSMGDIFRKNYIIVKNNDDLSALIFSKEICFDDKFDFNKINFQLVNNVGDNEKFVLKINEHQFQLPSSANNNNSIEVPINEQNNFVVRLFCMNGNLDLNKQPKNEFYPVIRRILTEVRDRLQPIIH